MRSIVSALVLLALTGCNMFHPTTTTGWRFEVLSPPTVLAPAVVTQGGNSLALASVAAVGSGYATRPMAAAALPGPCEAPAMTVPSGPTLAARPDCTLEDACRRINELERSSNPTLAMPRRMPKGPDSQP